jgi:hypothetical protein
VLRRMSKVNPMGYKGARSIDVRYACLCGLESRISCKIAPFLRNNL